MVSPIYKYIGGCTPRPLYQSIEELAERVGRLVPSHRDPERFHVEKSEIVASLREVARVLPDASDAAPKRPGLSLGGQNSSAKVPGFRMRGHAG